MLLIGPATLELWPEAVGELSDSAEEELIRELPERRQTGQPLSKNVPNFQTFLSESSVYFSFSIVLREKPLIKSFTNNLVCLYR